MGSCTGLPGVGLSTPSPFKRSFSPVLWPGRTAVSLTWVGGRPAACVSKGKESKQGQFVSAPFVRHKQNGRKQLGVGLESKFPLDSEKFSFASTLYVFPALRMDLLFSFPVSGGAECASTGEAEGRWAQCLVTGRQHPPPHSSLLPEQTWSGFGAATAQLETAQTEAGCLGVMAGNQCGVDCAESQGGGGGGGCHCKNLSG